MKFEFFYVVPIKSLEKLTLLTLKHHNLVKKGALSTTYVRLSFINLKKLILKDENQRVASRKNNFDTNVKFR